MLDCETRQLKFTIHFLSYGCLKKGLCGVTKFEFIRNCHDAIQQKDFLLRRISKNTWHEISTTKVVENHENHRGESFHYDMPEIIISLTSSIAHSYWKCSSSPTCVTCCKGNFVVLIFVHITNAPLLH